MPDTRGMMLQVGTQYTNRCHTQIALAALSVPKPNRPNSNSQGRSNAAGSVVRFNARIAKQHCGIPDPHLPLETIPVTGVPMQWWGVNWVLHTGHKGNTPNRGASLLARVWVAQASCNSHTPVSRDWLKPYWPVCGRGKPCATHTPTNRDAPLLGVLPLCLVCRTQLPLRHKQTSIAPSPLAPSLWLRQPQCLEPVLINIKSGKEAICPSSLQDATWG